MYKIHYFKSLTSTNDKVKGFNENSVVIAEIQTKGRGRFKRKWVSSKGGLWLSILLKPMHMGKLGYLTFCAAIACQKAVAKMTKLKSKVKWPNDLVVRNKKLCGILTESSFGNTKFAVVGIGMNTNNQIPKNLQEKAVSLRMMLNKKVDNRKLAEYILDEFESLYQNFNDKQYKQILKKWKSSSDTIGREVKIITRGKTIKGRIIGIDSDLRLILKAKGNKIKKIAEGDVVYYSE